MSFVGLDCGTSSARALVLSKEGKVLSFAQEEYNLNYLESGGVELNPERIWEAVKNVLMKACSETNTPVRVISLSCLGGAFIPVQKDGKALYPAILASDARAITENAIIQETIGREKVFQITGLPLSVCSLKNILWFKHNANKLFNKTWKFLDFESYILSKLGFKPYVDYSLASQFATFDIRHKCWSKEILEKLCLNSQRFPESVPPGTVLGTMPRSLADQLGLSKDTEIVIGAHDQVCASLGAGIFYSTPLIAANTAGSCETVSLIKREPLLTTQAMNSSIASYCALDDTYITVKGLISSGSIIKWFRDEFCSEEVRKAKRQNKDAYNLMIEPLEFKGKNILVLPHFAGTWEDSNWGGVFSNLGLATTKQDLLQGIIESLTYELKKVTNELEKVQVGEIESLHASGGSAKSTKWLQLKADVLGKPIVSLHLKEASALGAALIAGKAIGNWESFEEAIECAVRTAQVLEPDPQKQKLYEEQYARYVQLDAVLT